MNKEIATEECSSLGEAYDEGYQQGRADAIDDFAEFVKHNWRIEAAHVISDYPTTDIAIGKFLADLVDIIQNEYKEKHNDN